MCESEKLYWLIPITLNLYLSVIKLVSVCDLSLAPNIHYFGPSDNQKQILHLCLNAYVAFWIAH